MRRLFFIAIALFITSHVVSQNYGGITGKLLDGEANGEALLFATISLKNTLYSTQSNFHGNFEIADVAEGKYIMQISFLGYETLELPVLVEQNKIVHIEREMHMLSGVTPNLHFSEATLQDTSTQVEAKPGPIQE